MGGEEYLRSDIRASGTVSAAVAQTSAGRLWVVFSWLETNSYGARCPPPHSTPPHPNQLSAIRPGLTAHARRGTAALLVCMPTVSLALRQKTTNAQAKLSSNGWGSRGECGRRVGGDTTTTYHTPHYRCHSI